jgi:hypothetical protein
MSSSTRSGALVSIACTADAPSTHAGDRDIAVRGEQSLEPRPRRLFIVNDQDVDHASPRPV